MRNSKIFIVEDDYVFSHIVQTFLIQLGFKKDHIYVASGIADLELISNQIIPDVILLDLNVRDSFGKATFYSVNQKFMLAPIIILSSIEDNHLALSLVKEGAQDYLIKARFSSSELFKSIEYSMERKRLTIELLKSESKFRNIYDNSPLPMMVLDANLKINSTNNAADSFYKLDKNQLIDVSLYKLNFFKDNWSIDPDCVSFHKRIIQKTGLSEKVYVEIIANRISENDDQYICLIVDRTNEVVFEQKKKDLIQTVQNKEKKFFAMELHDGICQNLVLLNLWFTSFSSGDNSQVLRSNINDLIESTILESRNLAYKLLPPDFQDGFICALKNLLDRMDRLHNFNSELFIADDLDESLFEDIDIYNLYRIIQEFITNSVKHAKCSVITVSIFGLKMNDLSIIISDDGIGFDISTVSNGIGLKSIEHRMSTSGFFGEIQSETGKGTKLTISTAKSSVTW